MKKPHYTIIPFHGHHDKEIFMWNKQRIENTIWHLCGYDRNAVWRLKKWSHKGNGMTQRHVGDEMYSRTAPLYTKGKLLHYALQAKYCTFSKWRARRTIPSAVTCTSHRRRQTPTHCLDNRARRFITDSKNAMLSKSRLLWFCFSTLSSAIG